MSFEASCPLPIHHDERILLGHGSGGKLSARLLQELIVPILGVEALDDQATLPAGAGGRLAFTTDSFVVSPLFFPGGDIGALAVYGTVNDLAVGGAKPTALSLSLILEEGLPLEELERVLRSVRKAADRAEVRIVTGDTKVVERGGADRLFLNTAGVGWVREGTSLGASRIEVGDAILLSGFIGDHGTAIMAQRSGLHLEGLPPSDLAPLHGLVAAMLDAYPGIHAMRDPTRGGVAAALAEFATKKSWGIVVEEGALPVRDEVRGACELLGLDPMLVANEGKLLAFVPEEGADRVLEAMRSHPLGREARRIGEVVAAHPGVVVVETAIGGRRILDLPYAEQLPRIC